MRKLTQPHIFYTNCKRCGKPIASSRWSMTHPLGRICSQCTTPEEKQQILEYQAGAILKKNPERRYPTEADKVELIDLFHLARVPGKESRYDRMLWAVNEFVKTHPEWTKASTYKAMDEALQHHRIGMSRHMNPVTAKMLQLKPGQMFTCVVCGKRIADKYVIYNAASGKSYHGKCFQASRKKNPYPQICSECGAVIYGVITPQFCPVCGKDWAEELNETTRKARIHEITARKNPRHRRFMVDGRLKLQSGDRVKISKKGRDAVLKNMGLKIEPTDLWTVESIGYDISEKKFCVIIVSGDNRLYMYASDLIYYDSPEKNPMRSKLYESFHGTSPLRTRKVLYEPPPKDAPLVKWGKISQINYIPEHPSKRANTEFFHKFGDYGEGIKFGKNKPILATDATGKNLYVIKDKSKFHLTDRGIIG